MVRTMLDEYKTPNQFWAEAINTACYSINRLYLHRTLKKTSYELLTGKKVDLSSEAPSHLRKSISFLPSLSEVIISPDVLIHFLKQLL